MMKSGPIGGLRSFLISSLLLGMCIFQSLYAQDLSRHQAASQSGNLQFSHEDGLAYLEALEFCLTQTSGAPVKFNGPLRQSILSEFHQNFHTFPLDTQLKLSTARITWDLYKASWAFLNQDKKTAFMYDVLALAYGDAAASEVLGLSPTVSENYDDRRDKFCANNPGICP